MYTSRKSYLTYNFPWSAVKAVKPLSSETQHGQIVANKSTVKLTKSLYVSGHNQPRKQMCRNNGAELKLLVLVTSAPSHEVHRNVVRSTWGTFGNRLDINLAFFVGIPQNEADRELIRKENSTYGDIIQVSCFMSFKYLKSSKHCYTWTGQVYRPLR